MLILVAALTMILVVFPEEILPDGD